MSVDLDMADAVRDIVLALSPALIPQSTVANLAGTTVGAASLTVPTIDAPSFVQQGLLSFGDGTAEETLPIAAVDTTTGIIQFDFSGLGYSGLQYAHAHNAPVYTNLLARIPWEIAPMLNTPAGWPFVFVTVRQDVTNVMTQRFMWDVCAVRVQYHRLLNRQIGGMDANVWAMRQETRARSDLFTIRAALTSLRGQRLMVGNTAHATKMGAPNSGNGYVTTNWEKLEVKRDTWQLIATLDAVYTSIRQGF